MMPLRVQQSRAKGWRKPDNTVSVTRPGKFGNPFAAKIKRGEDGQATMTREYLVRDFRYWLTTELLWRRGPDGWRWCSPGGADYVQAERNLAAVDAEQHDPEQLDFEDGELA